MRFQLPHRDRAPRAFTLIELLIVVAIIAVLAAIAVPNFLEAQTRAKISRAKADMRTIATGLEVYKTDNNNYPPENDPVGRWGIQWMYQLTTPIAYLTAVNMTDPFSPPPPSGFAKDFKSSYMYVSYTGEGSGWGAYWMTRLKWARKGYVVHSFGPLRTPTWLEWYPYYYNHTTERDSWNARHPLPVYIHLVYDPTNGTMSRGGFGRAGGELNCPQAIGG